MTKGTEEKISYYWERVKYFGKRYKNFDWATIQSLLNFTLTYGTLDASLSRKARQYGLSRAALNVLTILSRSEGKGCQHHEISNLLLVSRANVTGLIDGLIRQGLVERVYDERDRRVCIARISKAGEKLLESFLPKYYKHAESMLASLTETEKKQLSALLTKMRSGIDQAERQFKDELQSTSKNKRNAGESIS